MSTKRRSVNLVSNPPKIAAKTQSFPTYEERQDESKINWDLCFICQMQKNEKLQSSSNAFSGMLFSFSAFALSGCKIKSTRVYVCFTLVSNQKAGTCEAAVRINSRTMKDLSCILHLR